MDRVCLRTATLLTLVAFYVFPIRAADVDQDETSRDTHGDSQVLVRWSFDRTGTQRDEESTGKSAYDVAAEIPRVRGVHGNAVRLSGAHQLRVPALSTKPAMAAITFSAWVKPTQLGSYREIYRQECPERILFSFQNNGTILSLGLNIGGYVECDAKIAPSEVLDGAWHHVAATFDGRLMHVFLDGREVGRMPRVGEIVVNARVPAFIGSSGGVGEHFQGDLDDLRIYSTALDAGRIAEIYRRGVTSIAARFEQLEQEVREFYRPRSTFAKTLVALRKAVLDKRAPTDRELIGLVLVKLKAEFAADYADFVDVTGISPLEFLTSESNGELIALVGRYVELMREYQPLTNEQYARQTPEQLQHWTDVARIADRFESLRRSGTSADASPEWIDVMLDAARHVQLRPTVSEAVAPYRKPETPETRDLTADESREMLRRDWLYQVDGHPTKAKIVAELGWTRQLTRRILSAPNDAPDLAKELVELAQIERQVPKMAPEDVELYCRLRDIKRRIVFKNPVVDFSRVLFVDMPFPAGSEWPHETRHRLGYMAVPGGRLLVLDGLSPRGQLRQLMPKSPLHGSFWRPDLSYDAATVVFCFKPHNEKAFHLYEINIDGTDCVQLTDGPYDDLDPIYLPDGRHVMFSTTRGHTYVRCMPPTNAYVLARCDRGGKNIFLVSRNNEPDYLPSVLDDGRVVYTRWEYTDKPLWRAQGLWTVNPDGTQVNTMWGNQSVWPDLLKDARGIPGSRRVMFTGSAHHNWFSGSVGIIDPTRGFNFPHGLTKVTADLQWPESGNGPVDPIESPRYHSSGTYSAYYSPFPLSDQDFLVSANRGGKFVLYLMDVDGNRELIYEGTNNIFHALPVRTRTRPAMIVDRVAWPRRADRLRPHSGVIFSGNVYHGAPGELKGKAKYLRVLNIEPKTYTYWHKRPYLSTGPVVSAVQSEGVKRVVGTVPIEEDGSVSFHAPAGVALHFQLLDGRFRAMQTMRSFTGVMPGEQRGCLGCHESHSRTPEYRGKAIAVGKEPQEIRPPPWGNETISYTRFVRPLLNKYCAQCHEGDGEARDVLDLTSRPGFLIFEEPYMILTGRPSWGTPYQRPDDPEPGFGGANMIMVEGYDQRDPAAYRTPKPMTHLSFNSPLVEIAASGEHYGVEVDALALRKLIAWIDAMCPYRGAEEVRQLEDPEFPGVDWLSVRPKIRTAPTIVRPGPVD